MRNLLLMILVVLLIIIDIVVLIELLNYGRDPLFVLLFLLASFVAIFVIVRNRKKTSQESAN